MDMPLFSVCELTTPAQSFADDVRTYSAQAGVTGIGIVEAKLTDSDTPSMVNEAGLAASICIPTAMSVLPLPPGVGVRAETADDQLRALCAGVERLAEFTPAVCLCLTGPRGSLSQAEAERTAVKGLRELARVASRVDVVLGLEPIHPSIAAEWSIVTRIDDTLALLDEAGVGSSAGLLYDVWHLWDVPDSIRATRRVAPRVVGVHVNDRRKQTRSWSDRTFPGEGVLDLTSLLGALNDGGFEGWYDLEILADETTLATPDPAAISRLPASEIVRRGTEAFASVWSARKSSAEYEA